MPSTALLTKSKPDILAMIESFNCSGDDLAAKSRELTIMLLEQSEYPFSRRQFTPGHITCTAAVLDPARERVLLMFHHRLLRWLLPGGHCEGDDVSISGVARREAIEETGVALAPGSDAAAVGDLVGIDVHGIPPKKKEPYHLHHDLIFAFRARSETIQTTPEAREVAWCRLAELDRYGVAQSIVRSVARAVML
jgi:8-oxo-dGTP pyrophosphatase MutT (NUDIX family)